MLIEVFPTENKKLSLIISGPEKKEQEELSTEKEKRKGRTRRNKEKENGVWSYRLQSHSSCKSIKTKTPLIEVSPTEDNSGNIKKLLESKSFTSMESITSFVLVNTNKWTR